MLLYYLNQTSFVFFYYFCGDREEPMYTVFAPGIKIHSTFPRINSGATTAIAAAAVHVHMANKT